MPSSVSPAAPAFTAQALHPSPYVHRFIPARTQRPRIRLFLFPFAGASASVYREWPARFDHDHEVLALQLPGRGSRLAEPAHQDYRRLVAEIAEAVRGEVADVPYAFFGHSMGALLAFQVACHFATRGIRPPECLFLSGRKAPHLPGTRLPVAQMSDGDFIEELRRMEGTPPALLQNRELMALLLPTVRADFLLLDDWQRQAPSRPERAPLRVPIHVLVGRRDPHCSPEDGALWDAYTDGNFELLEYNGGHFFVQSHQSRVIADVRQRLDARLVGA
ncbi:MAG: thioesterase [Rhodocyclaceae bacterium]|nr:thioesterase [Rhodocyclaceae bacterium]